MMAPAAAVYNKTSRGPNRVDGRAGSVYNKTVSAGGRPTNDPKGTLVAVRLSLRQVHVLEQRSRREDTGLSEAIRRCVDDWAVAQAARRRPSTPTKQEAFKKPARASSPRPTRRRTRRPAK